MRKEISRLFGIASRLLLLVTVPSVVWAQTNVTGVLEGNVRWTQVGGPYLLSGEVVVAPSAQLTIDPGVILYMGAGSGLRFRGASLNAVGTVQMPIQVLSENSRQAAPANPGDWNQWIFESGSNNVRLENVLIQHGKGLVLNAAQAVFNNLDLRSHAGPAIAIDLATSLSGAGNRAVGNQLNAVLVPAGSVSNSVQWGLRGIPFLVASGRIDVGAGATLAEMLPNTFEQGERASVALRGQRLFGLTDAQFERSVTDLSVLAGGTDTSAGLSFNIQNNAQTGVVGFKAMTDAGEISLPSAVTITPMKPPVVNGMTPRAIQRGMESTITLEGTSLSAATVSTSTAGLSVVSQQASRSALSFRMAVDGQVPLGVYPIQVTNAAGFIATTIEILSQIVAQPPFQILPSIVVLAPDSVYRNVVFRANQTSAQERRYTLSVENASLARLRSTEVVIPPGAYEGSIPISGLASGMTVLTVSGGDLSSAVEAPVNVTPGGTTQAPVSQAVGLMKGSLFLSTQGGGQAISIPVGLIKGSALGNLGGQAISVPVGVDRGNAWSRGSSTLVSPQVGISKQ